MEGSIVAGRYVINGIIGSGGMAIVYRGYDRQTGDVVAIKVLRSEYMQDEAYVKRFEKESQIAIKYSHKNIVRTIEVGCQDGRHYIVMELIDGMTLKEYIAKYGRLKPAEVVRIGWQICDALFYAHSHQLIHRDIKPQNILISRDGSVKVADFGIAKAPDTTLTMSGSNVLGSVHYISPEQARGGLIDEKADIYSIGIVFYEMVTGEVPFTGDSPVAVAIKHLQEMPRPPRELVPEIPKAMEMVILKAISKDPSARYDNAREMGRDLERTIQEPEGSYIKIKQVDEYEGTKPIHALRGETAQQAQQGAHGNAGPRRSAPVRPEPRRPRRRISASSVLLAVGVALGLLAVLYMGARAIIGGSLPKNVKVPKVTGLTLEVAQSRLDSVNLTYDVQEAANEKVEKGVVFEQDPGENSELPSGGTVMLTVSTGKQQVQVPDVSTQTFEQATDSIQRLGLIVGDVRYEESDMPKDTVVRQEPAAQEYVDIGSHVNIWLAKPAEQQTPSMPNLFGKGKDDAVSQLASLGITVTKIIPKNSSYVADTIIGQTPDAGTPVKAGDDVELWVSNGIPAGYHKDYDVHYDVPKDDTEVKIVYVDGDVSTTVYAKKEKAKSYDLTILLDSTTLGEKTLIIYFDGVEFKRETVTFEAGDAE